MKKAINVIIIDDDPYSCEFMYMLLVRDWRTRVSDFGFELNKRILDVISVTNILLIDSEFPNESFWGNKIADQIHDKNHEIKVVFTGTQPSDAIARNILDKEYGAGYILKKEISYSLAWAAVRVYNGFFVVTPSIDNMMSHFVDYKKRKVLVMNGENSLASLTQTEERIARLGILFNISHKELSDEYLIRSDQVSKHISNAYSKFLIKEIITGEISAENYFSSDLLLKRIKKIQNEIIVGKKSSKLKEFETFAFHILTLPEEWQPN